MQRRIITGFIGGAAFLFIVYLGGHWYETLVFLLATIGYLEFIRLRNFSIFSWHGIVGWLNMTFLLDPFFLPFSFVFSTGNRQEMIFAALLFLLALTVLSKNRTSFDDVAFVLTVSLFLGYGFRLMLETRLAEDGLAWTVLILSVTWATDTGAYFIGRAFGRKKLWPVISPNKTVEGALGGVISALLAAAVFACAYPFVSLPKAILLGAVGAVAAQLGDLIESAYKRHYDVKDTGTILPGHGGVLDRFDSLLVVFYVFHLFHLI
ncbi:phosphatidate cytidylyltransferase [Bacillaceae bacterium]